MDSFEKTYWSVYLDFLDDFKELKYKGHSISHFVFFLALFTREKAKDNLIKDMANYNTTNVVKDPSEVQLRFDALKKSYERSSNEKKQGKILLHDGNGLLRFPSRTFTKTFNAKNSILMKEKIRRKKKVRNRHGNKATVLDHTRIKAVKRSKKDRKIKGSLNFQYYDKYTENNKKEISRLQHQAREIIGKFKNHPLYTRDDFEKHLLLQIAKAVNRIGQVQNLFKEISFSCVIVPYQQLLEVRVLTLLAAEQGIPTICIQHGIISGKAGFLPKLVDIEAVYGDFEVNYFKSIGVKEEEVQIIGHPRFDQISSPPSMRKASFEKKIGINQSKKNILIIVRKDLKDWGKFVKKLNLQKEANIIVKDFPDHDPHVLTKMYPHTFSSKGCHLYDLLHYADVVVSYHSTVALEAMLAGKPVFILTEKFHGYSGYFEKLGELVQENPYPLANLVQKFFKSEKFKEYTQKKIESFLFTSYPNKFSSEEHLINLVKRLSN